MHFWFGRTCADDMQEVVASRQSGNIDGYLTLCYMLVADQASLEIEQAQFV